MRSPALPMFSLHGMQVYRHKFAVIFRKAVNPKDAPGYEKVREAKRRARVVFPDTFAFLVVRMGLIPEGILGILLHLRWLPETGGRHFDVCEASGNVRGRRF